MTNSASATSAVYRPTRRTNGAARADWSSTRSTATTGPTWLGTVTVSTAEPVLTSRRASRFVTPARGSSSTAAGSPAAASRCPSLA